MYQVPLVTCILLRYTKITVNSVYLLKGHTAWLYSLWDSYRQFLGQKHIASMVTVCIASFEAIGALQRKRLCQSHAVVFSWNAQTRGQSLQAKNWVPSSLPRHHPHRVWSVTGILYTGEVCMPCGGYCNRADFTELSKFPDILGELSMHERCVPGSFFSAHAWEPGNEAKPSLYVAARVAQLNIHTASRLL